MKQNQNEHLSQEAIRIHHLVKQLNQYRHEYYNMNAPSVSDAVYDCLFDELDALEKRTGIILSNSPTQTVGYQAVSQLDKVHHPIPLLSLDKTKQITEIHDFMKKQKSLLMLKLDGLTIKLTYENGRLIEASTRGDGDEGEIVTHNASAFRNIPLSIPYQKRQKSGRRLCSLSGCQYLQRTFCFLLCISCSGRTGRIFGAFKKPRSTPYSITSSGIRHLSFSGTFIRSIP